MSISKNIGQSEPVVYLVASGRFLTGLQQRHNMCLNTHSDKQSCSKATSRWSSLNKPQAKPRWSKPESQPNTRARSNTSPRATKKKQPETRARSATLPLASTQPRLKLSSPTTKLDLRMARGPGWCTPFSRCPPSPVIEASEPKCEPCHWCLHADCLESTENYSSVYALAIHAAKDHVAKATTETKKKNKQRKRATKQVDSDSGYSGSDTESTPTTPVAIDFNAIMGSLKNQGIKLTVSSPV
jgi:hypothetical protein